MKYFLCIIGCIATLTGCVPAASYDIDVKCKNAKINFTEYEKENDINKYVCFEELPDYKRIFEILCDKNTVQKIENKLFCTTEDGKHVRIQLYFSDEKLGGNETLELEKIYRDYIRNKDNIPASDDSPCNPFDKDGGCYYLE